MSLPFPVQSSKFSSEAETEPGRHRRKKNSPKRRISLDKTQERISQIWEKLFDDKLDLMRDGLYLRMKTLD